MPRITRNAQELLKIAQDLRARKALVQHGRHIFMYRHVQTNQVLYSFYPGLDKRHLDQIPFIGKKSKPAQIRPDLWAPYCTVNFPTPEQGLDAFKRLRELRTLHETRWDVHNQGWEEVPKKVRIKKIQDQEANSVADLAQVLAAQKEIGLIKEETSDDVEIRQERFLKKLWAEVEPLAQAVKEGELGRVQTEMKQLTKEVASAVENKDSSKVQRLTAVKQELRQRNRKMLWARDLWHKHSIALGRDVRAKRTQEAREAAIAERERVTAEERLQYAKDYNVSLEALELSEKEQTAVWSKIWDSILLEQRQDVARKKRAPPVTVQREEREKQATMQGIPKRAIEVFEDDMARSDGAFYMKDLNESLLPDRLKTSIEPYSLQNVEIKWADLRSAEFVPIEKWPQEVVHDSLGMIERGMPLPDKTKERGDPWITREEYEQKLKMIQDTYEANVRSEEDEMRKAKGRSDSSNEEPKQGIWKYVPKVPSFGRKPLSA
ncbi:hypothetical protein EJ04DRAFT_577233 [Polyplosphaeria fusca]|uniref:Large ribosomal subunit protein mL67 n=1 Tax=Polyplosphaeria fusca TaxID=682080 RepID=A0A9P4QZH4_9PLEO|nr:hypothetical protein EJ04DRAFT_577233 [Polyplosphaeria fusca]